MDIPHLKAMYPLQHYYNTYLYECDGMIPYRVNLRHLNVYTIDPVGCEDADDGFSIEIEEGYTTDERFNIYVHIADPTAYMKKYDNIFNFTLDNCVSQYPSFVSPKHMLSPYLLQKCSLMNGVKHALTIKFEFDKFKCVNRRLFFSYVECRDEYKYSYDSAAANIFHSMDIQLALRGSKILSNERNKKFKSLSNMNLSTPKYNKEGNFFYLHKSSDKENILKTMIAELAIASNTAVANLIYSLNQDYIFTRNCTDNGVEESDNPTDTLASIIQNGIRANYNPEAESHDIIGTNLYTHATSPLRRVSDIIVHLILKDLIKNEPSFSKEALFSLSQQINKTSKYIKNIHMLDSKYRIFQCIKDMIDHFEVIITFRFISYTGLFINLIIEQINEHKVYASYTIKCKPRNYNSMFVPNQIGNFICKECNLPNTKFDIHVLPDLEKLFFK